MTAVPAVTDARPERDSVDLAITGMTCAACAARIEKKLNRLDGVEASVNYATEHARVTFNPSALTAHQLIETVASIGYGATLPAPPSAPTTPDQTTPDPTMVSMTPADAHLAGLRQRLIVSSILGLPVLLLSMISALQLILMAPLYI